MKQNEIDVFNIPDGELIYTRTKTKKPLSKKHLLLSLSEYFKEDKNMVEQLGKFILDTNTKRLPFPPLRYILKTPAFLALTVVHFGQSWGYITLMTEIPSYLSNVHHYSITSASNWLKL